MPTLVATDSMVMPATPQAIWDVLADVAKYPQWWPVPVDTIRPTEQVMGTRYWVRVRGKMGVECQLESLRPPHEMRVRYRDGVMRGQAVWRLKPEPAGTLVSYSVELRTAHWLVSLAGRFTDLAAGHSASMQRILEALGERVAAAGK